MSSTRAAVMKRSPKSSQVKKTFEQITGHFPLQPRNEITERAVTSYHHEVSFESLLVAHGRAQQKVHMGEKKVGSTVRSLELPPNVPHQAILIFPKKAGGENVRLVSSYSRLSSMFSRGYGKPDAFAAERVHQPCGISGEQQAILKDVTLPAGYREKTASDRHLGRNSMTGEKVTEAVGQVSILFKGTAYARREVGVLGKYPRIPP
jgi:hypothetical protein